MECATNVNDLPMHNNLGLGDKLGNVSAPKTSTKPVSIDGETPCGVEQSPLPFCEEDDEDEIFFGQVSSKEHHRAKKFEDRRTALFVQGFRNDRKLMRYTIDMRRSQCNIDSEKCINSEYKHRMKRSLSSICEENKDQDPVDGTYTGTEPEKFQQSFASQTNCDMGMGKKLENVSPVTAAKVADETGRVENKAQVLGNGNVGESERHADAFNLLHFFACVCALEPHQDTCETSVKDEMVMLEKTTRDIERVKCDGNGDKMTGNDTSSTDNDETSIHDLSCTENKAGDSRDDEEDSEFDSDESDVVIFNTDRGDKTESESCDSETDMSEPEVDQHVDDIDTSMGSDTKLNIPGVDCITSKLGQSEANSCNVVESDVSESGIDFGMSGNECIHGSFNCDCDDEVAFGPVIHTSDSEKNGHDCDCADETCEVNNVVNSITCEISQMELNTECEESDGSGKEPVKTILNVTKHDTNGRDIRGSFIEGDQSGSDIFGDVTMPHSSQQSTAECFDTEHINGANVSDFHELSKNATTPAVPIQQIHNDCCSAFQMYRKRDAARSEDSHVDFPGGAGKNDINGSKEISVKLDFDSVMIKTNKAGASNVSQVAAGLGASITCVMPIDACGEFCAVSRKTNFVVATPTFIPPTPHTTSILACPSVRGCHGNSVTSDQCNISSGPRSTHSTTLQEVADLTREACPQESSNHSLPSFASPALTLTQDREVSHDSHANLHSTDLHAVDENNLTMATTYSCQSSAVLPVSSRTFTPTVLQESTKIVATVTPTKIAATETPTVSRNPGVTSPGVVFTEGHFLPTMVSSRLFREEAPFGGNLCPSAACTAVSDDEGEYDVVPPTPKVSYKLSSPSVVFTEKHYSPTSMGRIDNGSNWYNHGDTIDAVVKSDLTSEDSPQIVFKVHNFSPVVIQNDALLRRVPSCEKTCGSTKCEHCATVVLGNVATSPSVTGKGRSLQRVNRLKLKKATSIRKASILSPCKKTPKKSHPDGNNVTPNRWKQRPQPSPLVSQMGVRTEQDIKTPTLPRTPTSDAGSRLRQVKEGNLRTPSCQPPIYRRGTPRHKTGLLGSKVTRLPSPLGQRTLNSDGRQQPQKRTESDDGEVSQERRLQLKQSHRDKMELPGKVSSSRGTLRAAFSPGVPKLLRMYDSPMTYTSADNLPRVRYKEKGLNQVQLDAITQLHTLCNSQQAVRYITRPRVGGAVKRVQGKVCSRLSWQEDKLSNVPEDKHAPPSLDHSPSPKSILHVKPLTQLYPYSDEPLSPVVIHKAVRKTNTLAQTANRG